VDRSDGLILAMDVGSSSIKAALVDARGFVRRSYRTDVPMHVRDARKELPPDRLWDAVAGAARRLTVGADGARLPDADKVAAISVVCQMAGLVLLDGDMRPVRDAIPGVDNRAAGMAAEIAGLVRESAAGIRLRTGCPPEDFYPAVKWLWLRRHEPDVVRRTRYAGTLKDELLRRLTGRWITDPASASSTGWYDQREKRWWPRMLEALGLDDGMLPEIVPPRAIAGTLTGEAADRLGLPAGLPVAAGSGDGPAASLSAGAIGQAPLCLSLGTTAVARLAVRQHGLPQGPYFQQHFDDGWYFQGIRLAEAGSRIGPLLGEAANGRGRERVRETMAELSLALHNGMRPLLDREPVREIRATGGGTANAEWMRMLADLFGVPVAIPENADGTLGAAIIGAVALGWHAGWEDACRSMARTARRFEPGGRGNGRPAGRPDMEQR
jgi:sugar (pentulose or hexulose) kinase